MSFIHRFYIVLAAGCLVAGCQSSKLLENGCERSCKHLYPYDQSLQLFKLGQTETEVAEIMRCPPVSRYANPTNGISECYWFYAHTLVDKEGTVHYNGQINSFTFRNGRLIGAALNNPAHMFGENCDNDKDAMWFYTKNARAKSWEQFNRLAKKKFFYNDRDQCYVHASATKEVDYWEGRTCHWKVGPCKVGYTRVQSPDGAYHIDVPNDKVCEAYLGNGRFRLRPKNAPPPPPEGADPNAVPNATGNLFADIVGEMAGAFLEGAVDGLTQSATDAALRKINRHHHVRSGTNRPASGGGTPAPSVQKKSGVKPRVNHSSCNGTGTCPICRGRLKVGGKTCTGCGGSGRCRACGGRGYVN